MTPNDVLDTDLIVDNSILSSVAQCHTQATMRHVLGRTTERESAAIMAGQYCHEALAWWLCNKSVDECLARLKPYETWCTEHGIPGDDRLAYNNVLRIMKRWFQQNPRESFPYVVEPANVEVPLVAVLGEIKGRRVVMVALLDALGKSKSGGWWTIDHKTTKTLGDWFKADLDDSAQFTGQLWIALQNDKPLSGVAINGIELKVIPSSNRKCSTHSAFYSECGISHVTFDRFTATRTPAEIATWEVTATKLAAQYLRLLDTVKGPEDIANVPMQGRFTRACSNCEFREWCSMGRPQGSVRTFTERRWNPLERAKEHAAAVDVIR